MKRRLSLLYVAVLMVTTTFISLWLATVPAFAWGPERTTYTNDSPADHATFNSITDNVVVGDERNFVQVGELDSSDPYADEIKIVAGKEYQVYIYYHNDAASNLNSSANGGMEISLDMRVSSKFPTVIAAHSEEEVSAVISFSTTGPEEVWDEASFINNSDKKIYLRYKDSSAVFHSNGNPTDGSLLSTALFSSTGTLIGNPSLNGTIYGCAEYSGYITYTVVAEADDSAEPEEADLDTNVLEIDKSEPSFSMIKVASIAAAAAVLGILVGYIIRSKRL